MSIDKLRELRNCARDCSTTPLSRLNGQMERVCFIVCCEQKAYRTRLGTQPLERSIQLATLLGEFGYDVLFMVDPHVEMLAAYLEIVVAHTSGHFILSMIGQPDEESDEGMIFTDETLETNRFYEILSGATCPSVTILRDYVVENSVFTAVSEEGPERVVISVQGPEDLIGEGSGILFSGICKELENKHGITCRQLQNSLRILVRRHHLNLAVAATNDSLLDQPFAVYNPKPLNSDLLR